MKSPIIVIADDFTGAAEIAGIGLRHGLKVEILTTLHLEFQADLVVISANTRSLSALEAQEKTRILTEQIAEIKPQLLFKKIDSVLRGHILAETHEILAKIPFEKTLILPANPSLKRTIIEGKYFVNGISIEETSFANDPEFAIKSSCVLTMIKAENNKVQVLKTTDILPEKGIFIAEASTNEDIEYWASQANQNTLLVGAADFFNAILAKYCQNTLSRNQVLIHENTKLKNAKTLYISGTTFGKSVQAIAQKSQLDGSVSYLPKAFFNDKNEAEIIQEWANEILCLLQNHNSVIVAIGDLSDYEVLPTQLAKWMGLVVKKVLENSEIHEFLIEGGATAAAILQTLSFTRFTPTNEFSQGVIRMKCQDDTQTYLTIKPGSYEWSKEIWEF